MKTTKIFCRFNGYIEGSKEEIKKFLNGDTNSNVKCIARKEGYIPADSIEEFMDECNEPYDLEDWDGDDIDFSVKETYTL